MSYLDDLSEKKLSASEEQKHAEQLEAVTGSGERVVEAVAGGTKELTNSIHELLMATLVSKDPKIAEVAKKLVALVDEINKATSNIKDTNFKPLADGLKALESTLADIPSQIEEAHRANNFDEKLADIAAKIGAQKFDPKITVTAPKVDLSPVTKLITGVEKALKDFKVDIPETNLDSLQEEMRGVKNAINGLSFPVPNYVLPFKASDGKATQVQLDSSGNLPISGSISVDTTGLATSAKQDTGNSSLSSIDGKITAVNTGAVVVSSSVLPSGAATSAKQDTGNTSVASIDTKMNDGTQKTQIVDAGGDAVTVTGGKLDVNATISGSGGGTSSIDDAAFTAGTDTGTPMMGFASADTVDSGDVGVLAMDTARNLKVVNQANGGVDIGDVTINNASGGSAVNIQDGGNSITVDYATTGSGTATGALRVELPTNGTGVVGLNAGTNAIGKLAANSGVDIGDVDVTSVNGFVAHDSPAAGAPLLMGGYASAAAPASVSGDADAVRAWYLRNGAAATVLTAAGALIGGDATNGLDVDVTRMSALVAGSAIIGKVGIDQTTAGTTNAVSIAQLGTTTVDTNSGNKSAGTQRIVIATDQPNLTTPLNNNVAQMNGVTVTMGNGSSGTGVQRVSIASDSTGQVAPAANATATGTAIYNNTALSNTKTAANASAGNLYGYHIYNPNAVVIYVQFWNLASASVTVGTTAATMILAVPPLGWADASPATPISFSTAMTIAATTTATGSSAPSTGLLVNLWYK